MDCMKTIPIRRSRNQQPTSDPHHAAAVERGKAAVRKLQEQGIIDKNGRRIRTDLPVDMQEGMSVEYVKDLPPAQEVVQRLWRECETAQ
jgi:hypothetical protein